MSSFVAALLVAYSIVAHERSIGPHVYTPMVVQCVGCIPYTGPDPPKLKVTARVGESLPLGDEAQRAGIDGAEGMRIEVESIFTPSFASITGAQIHVTLPDGLWFDLVACPDASSPLLAHLQHRNLILQIEGN